ncbi:MAG TPA: nitroreductase family protein [Myxococcales bacterium]|jgi:nitroreductase
MNDLEAIRARRSVRTYLPDPLTAEERAGLERALASCAKGPFGTEVRFALVALGEAERGESQALWTYGVIRHATTFVAGAIDPRQPGATLDFGHCLERVILEATKLGLGTCWLGGTFRAGVFASRMCLPAAYEIPCVTPVGRGAEKRTLVEKAFRTFAGSDRRKPWSELFFEGVGRRSLTPESAGRFAEPLECLRLAPSASNKQPWRVFKAASGEAWHFGLARNTFYDRSVSAVSLQEIDLGIGMSHFELACRTLGIAGSLKREPRVELPGGIEHVATWS